MHTFIHCWIFPGKELTSSSKHVEPRASLSRSNWLYYELGHPTLPHTEAVHPSLFLGNETSGQNRLRSQEFVCYPLVDVSSSVKGLPPVWSLANSFSFLISWLLFHSDCACMFELGLFVYLVFWFVLRQSLMWPISASHRLCS